MKSGNLMKKIFLLLIVIPALLLAGCETQQTDIAATTLPVYEFTQRLCQGTGLTVSRLVTENVSCLHDYSLQVRQMRILESAKVTVLSGAGLEDFLSDALHLCPNVIESSQGISLIHNEGHHHHEEHHEDEHDHHEDAHGHHHENDPHIWLSPLAAKQMAQNICSGLSQLYPEHKATFEANLIGLLKDLDALQAYGEDTLKDLSTRHMITFHDGFSYFAQAFDLEIVESVEEESGSEASASQLIELIALVDHYQLPAIFTEKNSSSAAADIIASETGCKLFQLDMAMSADSYFDAMYHNIDTIKEALG